MEHRTYCHHYHHLHSLCSCHSPYSLLPFTVNETSMCLIIVPINCCEIACRWARQGGSPLSPAGVWVSQVHWDRREHEGEKKSKTSTESQRVGDTTHRRPTSICPRGPRG